MSATTVHWKDIYFFWLVRIRWPFFAIRRHDSSACGMGTSVENIIILITVAIKDINVVVECFLFNKSLKLNDIELPWYYKKNNSTEFSFLKT